MTRRNVSVLMKFLTSLFLLVLLLPSCSFCADLAAAANIISLVAMNSPAGMKRIDKGYFRTVYRGFASSKDFDIKQEEFLGFQFMLDLPCMSRTLRTLIVKNQESGLPYDEALKKALSQHAEVLKKVIDSYSATSTLYKNSNKPPDKSTLDDLTNPEAQFIWTTAQLYVARLYGALVMVIEEIRPRGIDLNGLARDSKYYALGTLLKDLFRLRLFKIVGDRIADRDEYVIPSFVSSDEVTGLIVYEKPLVQRVGQGKIMRIAFPPPKVLRVYRKYFRNGARVIDVLDRKDRLVARLSSSVSASAIKSGEPRSSEELPGYIQQAWNKYVQSLRKN